MCPVLLFSSLSHLSVGVKNQPEDTKTAGFPKIFALTNDLIDFLSLFKLNCKTTKDKFIWCYIYELCV